MNEKYFLAADIGGSHITTALVNAEDGCLLESSIAREHVNSKGEPCEILEQWIKSFKKSLQSAPGIQLEGVGFAMPGPFNYTEGIALFEGVNKYDSLYGINIRQQIINEFSTNGTISVCFDNDASCFGLGESWSGAGAGYKRIMAFTLGTGFGSTFIVDGKVVNDGEGVPPGGYLYNSPFKGGIAEDYISTARLVSDYTSRTGNTVKDARAIYIKATEEQDPVAIAVFKEFGQNLAECIAPWIKSFKADCVVIGGNLTGAQDSFMPYFKKVMESANISVPCFLSVNTEQQAMAGAALVVKQQIDKRKEMNMRKTTQPLLPACLSKRDLKAGEYDIYPATVLADNKIQSGYGSLAKWICTQKQVLIDGLSGNDWKTIQQELSKEIKAQNKTVLWYDMSAFLKEQSAIDALVQPFMGQPGTVWGKRATCTLQDFYDVQKMRSLKVPEGYDVVILIGVGAAIAEWDAPVVYIDLPKDEVQYRMRAKSIFNLGASVTDTDEEMYKRFYFIDWVVLFEFKKQIADRIEIVADGQNISAMNWAFLKDIRNGIKHIAGNVLRARPWFAAGAWGGTWMKDKIKGLNKDEVNYAWSFELIVPENGMVFESNKLWLEIAFDWLMLFENKAILGADAERFGMEFPIRFDFLDTFDGGNLSIQCHPSLSYIKENFGENITQDETYYILDCKDDAQVYLGFQESINKDEFYTELQKSASEGTPIEIEKYVQKFPAHKHDLFLIPNGTVHSSGANNMVLEISATPYIFTFKMYDWVRPGLDGKPRPINIDHAFKNLRFERKGEKVSQELISKQVVIEQTNDCKLIHTPTHPDHFYDVHRMEFTGKVNVETNNKAHVLMLVEGSSITVETANGEKQQFNYAETFVIPAAAEHYTITNNGSETAKVVKAFVK